jgi:membrane dipeptidase
MKPMKPMKTMLIATTLGLGCFSCSNDAEESAKKGEVHQGYSDTAPEYEVNGRIISNVDLKAYSWNPRGKSDEQIKERAAFLLEAYDLAMTPEQEKRAKEVREKYQDAVVVNSIMIGAPGCAGTGEEHFAAGLKRNLDAGVTLVSVTAFAYPSDGTTPVRERLATANAVLKTTDWVIPVKSVDDIMRAKKEGKLGVMFNTQGADYAVDDLGMMAQVKKMGVNVSNFVYNNDNALAGGGAKQGSGVTELGKTWIEECNKLKIVVDVSHSSNQTAIEAAKLSKKPVIASHSNAAGIFKLNRNISDEAIKAVGASGGVVASTGVGLFLNEKGVASPEEFAKHVEYTANLIGRDKTGFSTDYMHAAKDMFLQDVANVKVFPPEDGFGVPASNMAAEHAWAVAAVLEDKYGWEEEDVRGFLGGNLLRAYKANWED